MGEIHLKLVKNQLIIDLETISNEVSSLKESLQSESKSTAGDKHETGRASIQLEIEQMSKQVKLKEEMLYELERIRFDPANDSIQAGSCIHTSIGEFILGIALGKITEEKIMVISLNSPFAKKALGLKMGDVFEMNGREVKILKVS